MVPLRVVARDIERGRRQIDGGDLRLWQCVRQGDGNGSGTGADIDDVGVIPGGGECDGLFDEVLRLGAWDEHVGRDAEWQAVELAHAGDVLDGFAVESALDSIVVALRRRRGNFLVCVGKKPGFVGVEEMEQQRLGIEPDAFRVRPAGEPRCRLCDGGCDAGHGYDAVASAFNCSAW